MRNSRSIVVLLLLFVLCPLFLSASQRLFDGKSEEYRLVRLLCQRAGVVGPSTALPVNSDELIIALDRIDYDLLPSHLKGRYDEIYKELSSEYSSFDYNIPVTLAPSFYIASEQNQDRKNFFLSYVDEKPLMNFALEMFFSAFLSRDSYAYRQYFPKKPYTF